MTLRIIGEHPLARDANNRLRSRIATIFPETGVLVTLPGIHATQRFAYSETLNSERAAAGQSPLTDAEQGRLWEDAVDLIMEDDNILIRPDPANMPSAFAADRLLLELVPKQRIKFLCVLDQRVRDAIKHRGELWRICPLPRTAHEMREMIAQSRIGIGGHEIYYYSKPEGIRWVTCQEFVQLAALPGEEMRRHLVEIQSYATRCNRLGRLEVQFFMGEGKFGVSDFSPYDFQTLPATEMRTAHQLLAARFRDAVDADLQHDNPDNLAWRNRMFAALVGRRDEVVSEETLLGLGDEFFMQIEWLPGAHIVEGELFFDDVCDLESISKDPSLERLCDDKCRGFIFNFIREYGGLEYVNVGRIVSSLSRRTQTSGRRDVYVAVLKSRSALEEIVRIIRMQKWGVRELLDQGKDFLGAILQAEEYTNYILDRRLACRQLGMNVPLQITPAKISEYYDGYRPELKGQMIWSVYFVRDYIRGIASDKLPPNRLTNPWYAKRFAQLLGRAAAPNLIVGRCDYENRVIFDDGDEIVSEDRSGLPIEIVTTDHTGTFTDYLSELGRFAVEYAGPVNRRLQAVTDAVGFARTYLAAFQEQFEQIQTEYRNRRRAFDVLFRHRPRDEAGSFAYRWEKVLERLDQTDVNELTAQIRTAISLQAPPT